MDLAALASEVFDGEALAIDGDEVDFFMNVPAGLNVRADAEQLFRVISNLVRNARQAITASGQKGSVTLTAEETDSAWTIWVEDTGPGLPERAKDNLFRPFQAGVRKGGSGLGLAIAQELYRRLPNRSA